MAASISELASANAGIWFSHDGKDFGKVEENAKRLFTALGYKKNVEKAAGMAANAYSLYDKGWEHYPSREADILFSAGLKTHKDIRGLFGTGEKSGYYHHKWWMAFGKKKYWQVLFWLFLHHWVKFGGINPIKPLKASWLLGWAGVEGHDERKLAVAEKKLEAYWGYCLKNGIRESLIY